MRVSINPYTYLQVVVLELVVVTVLGHGSYMDLIPNGHNVLNPCDGSSWMAVGHRNHEGGPRLNSFGQDFSAHGHSWAAVCSLDSDGDGKTNGMELGDPQCQWTAGSGSAPGPVVGHPGICEPLGSDLCQRIGSDFTCSPTVPVG